MFFATAQNAFAIKNINFVDNNNGTATITAEDTDKIAVAQYNSAGALMNFGISSLMGEKQTVTMNYDRDLTTNIFSFTDWSTLSSDMTGHKLDNNTLVYVDFEGGVESSYVKWDFKYDIDTAYKTTDRKGNETTALRAKTGEEEPSGEYNIQFGGAQSNNSDFVVYEYDMMANDGGTSFVSHIKAVDESGERSGWHKLWYVTPIEDNDETVTLSFGDGSKAVAAKNIDVGKWYRLSAATDFKLGTVKYYLDGTYLGEESLNETILGPEDSPDIFYIRAMSREQYTDFTFDNIRVYEGTELRDTIEPYEINIDTSITSFVVHDEKDAREVFDGKYLIHTRSGVATDTKGNKTLLENTPYLSNGEIYVNVKELCKAWNISAPSSITEENVKLSALAAALGLNVYNVDADINSGLVVLATEFTKPKDNIQELNNYAFYLRASSDDVKKTYKDRDVYGVHPRVMATQADFDRLKEMYEADKDETFMRWAEQTISAADSSINTDDATYETMLSSGRTAQRKLKADVYSCAMAYHLTHDKKYADAVFDALNVFCEFSDWKPSDHLHIAETMEAFAIGYDWLYNEFTETQRKTIEKNIYDKGFFNCYLGFRTPSSAMTSAYYATNNHGTVCNSGVVLAAAAFLDVFPDECSWFISNAMQGMEYNIDKWNTGAWWEGPHYWEYAMIYTVKYLESLESVFGTTFGFEYLEGLDKAAEIEINMQSTLGIFNYADAITARIYIPEMLWLAEKYDNSAVAAKVIDEYDGTFPTGNRRLAEPLTLSLLWYNPKSAGAEYTFSKDLFHEDLDVATMRESWDDGSVFVGIKGGVLNQAHSQLDSGSFIFESNSIRWLQDLGMGSYVDGYFDTTSGGRRWYDIAARGEGHNTVTVNPGTAEDMNLYNSDATAEMTKVASSDKGAIVKIDMSEVLFDVDSATRGFFYTDNRQSLVVRDEITVDNQKVLAEDNFDGKTSTTIFGSNESHYEIMTGEKLGLSATDNVAKLTGDNNYFNSNKWNANTGSKVATYEFDLYLEKGTDKFQFYPTGTNRYGIEVGGDNACTVKVMSPNWKTTSTGKTMTAGSWHKFAVEYDMSKGQMLVYMDNAIICTESGLSKTSFVPADHYFNCRAGNVYVNNVKSHVGSYIPKDNVVYWHLITDPNATVSINSDTNTITMTKGSLDSEKCIVEYVVTGAEKVEATYENPIVPTLSTVHSHTRKNGRVMLKLLGIDNKKTVTVTAKITPGDTENPSALSAYTEGISAWKLN